MGNPDGTAVNYDALLNDAKTWDQQQQTLNGTRAKIQSLHLSPLQLGQLFAPLYGVYNQVANRLEQAAGQGATAMGNVAESLRETVDEYRGTDHRSGHNVESLPHIEIPHF